MEFTVDRSKWLRGEGSTRSYLLRDDQKMCCLGFRALACGHTADELLGVKTPNDITNRLAAHWANYLDGKWSSGLSRAAMVTNDDEWILDKNREATLVKQFAELGDTVTFVDGPL